MSAIIRNGWEIYFHRKLFGEQRRQLKEQVSQLKIKLPPSEFVKHPTVKLLAAVMTGIKEKIVLDPFAPQFILKGSLKPTFRTFQSTFEQFYNPYSVRVSTIFVF